MPRIDVYQIVTDRIIQALKAGVVAWHKPWKSLGVGPRSLVSGKPYRGVNYWLLSLCSSDRWFLTYKQAQKYGANVKRGEKGYPVVYWLFFDAEEKVVNGVKTKVRRPPVPRYYTVFGLSQIENLKLSPAIKAKLEGPEKREVEPLEACEEILKGYTTCPTITYGGDRAYYRPSTDTIGLPERDQFDGAEEFYSTAFHELVHSTGHTSRLSREEITDDNVFFGSKNYSKEELVAELGAAMLCALTGVENKTIDNSAAYIQSWLKKLEQDPKLILQASSKAQKAVDYITGYKAEEDAEAIEESGVTA